MRTTLDIDGRLLKEAMARARVRTKTAAVERGLQELINAERRHHTQVKALRMLDHYRFRRRRAPAPTSLTLLKADRHRASPNCRSYFTNRRSS